MRQSQQWRRERLRRGGRIRVGRGLCGCEEGGREGGGYRRPPRFPFCLPRSLSRPLLLFFSFRLSLSFIICLLILNHSNYLQDREEATHTHTHTHTRTHIRVTHTQHSLKYRYTCLKRKAKKHIDKIITLPHTHTMTPHRHTVQTALDTTHSKSGSLELTLLNSFPWQSLLPFICTFPPFPVLAFLTHCCRHSVQAPRVATRRHCVDTV